MLKVGDIDKYILPSSGQALALLSWTGLALVSSYTAVARVTGIVVRNQHNLLYNICRSTPEKIKVTWKIL